MKHYVRHTLPGFLRSQRFDSSLKVWAKATAPEEQTRIFDRFYRVNSDHRHTGGSGLGLLIDHAIATAHQGSL